MLNIAVEVNHITVPVKDKRASARLLAYILGLKTGHEVGTLARVHASNGKGLTLDFFDAKESPFLQCAFLLSEMEFDAALSRINCEAIRFYGEFDGTGSGQINRLHGSRGLYFDDPNGHLFELIEQRYATVADRGIKAVAIKVTSEFPRRLPIFRKEMSRGEQEISRILAAFC